MSQPAEFPNSKLLLSSVHRFFAIECNNRCWPLFDIKPRTPEDNDHLLNVAYAAAFHWSQVGKPANDARAQWTISRACVVAQAPEAALRHAERCMAITNAHYDGEKFAEGSGFEDWDLAFAAEAMARALVWCGRSDEAQQYMTMAKMLGAAIKGAEDRQVFMETFEGGPWNPNAA
jgi:hypothetical protein